MWLRHFAAHKSRCLPNHVCEGDCSVYNVHQDFTGVANDVSHHRSDSIAAFTILDSARFDESINESCIPMEDSILPIDDSGNSHDTGYSSEMVDDHLECLAQDVKRLTHEIALWKRRTTVAWGLLKKAGVEYEEDGEEGEEDEEADEEGDKDSDEDGDEEGDEDSDDNAKPMST